MNNELIERYIGDKKFLYEAWYQKKMAMELGLDEDVEYKGEMPTIDDIKNKFNEWLGKNKSKLYKLICEKFNYNKNKFLYSSSVELIKEISKIIGFDYSPSTEIASILVEIGLDNLCEQI